DKVGRKEGGRGGVDGGDGGRGGGGRRLRRLRRWCRDARAERNDLVAWNVVPWRFGLAQERIVAAALMTRAAPPHAAQAQDQKTRHPPEPDEVRKMGKIAHKVRVRAKNREPRRGRAAVLQS